MKMIERHPKTQMEASTLSVSITITVEISWSPTQPKCT